MNVVGIITRVNDNISVTTKDGRTVTRKTVVLKDKDMEEIQLCLWGGFATAILVPYDTQPGILVVQHVTTHIFRGILSLSTTGGSSQIHFDESPTLPQACDLLSWWNSHGNKTTTFQQIKRCRSRLQQRTKK